ncbi:hypothetical protein [Acetobacter thailandicus]|uniref:hypothetical protein n=1 Tax=Acetobacter thailandicus TaxID=1502842 RepID=UPI001BA59DDB|nr:hypothetical protein [Acetobacter thailandicus]MBS0961291.1 hypothetical protein [Acetobacter thailandicus]
MTPRITPQSHTCSAQSDLHPLVLTLIRDCPSRAEALRAAHTAQQPPPNQEDVIFKSGYTIFSATFGTSPSAHNARGHALEAAFRPLLAQALDLLETLPSVRGSDDRNAAQHILRTYVTIHWTLGARAAAMARYNAP